MSEQQKDEKPETALPCVHCGSKALVSRLAGWGQVRCSNMRECNARTELHGGVAVAVKAWNRRVK